MDKTIALKLLAFNQEFYNIYAQSFSSTRYAIQPGVRLLLPRIINKPSVLDLGCGNGNLAISLLKAGFSGVYEGIDNSASLLEDAKATIPRNRWLDFKFSKLDLSSPDWADSLQKENYASVCVFAFLHHIPGEALALSFFEKAAGLLKSGGELLLSCWQVQNSARLLRRIVSWSELGFDPSLMTENDLLLDWKAEQGHSLKAYRFVHQFSPEELNKLGKKVGLEPVDTFLSDGRQGNLGLYQIWSKP